MADEYTVVLIFVNKWNGKTLTIALKSADISKISPSSNPGINDKEVNLSDIQEKCCISQG